MTDEQVQTPATDTRSDADHDVAGVTHHDNVTPMDPHAAPGDDDHGHAESTLGPIDWGKWAFAICGGFAGLVVLAFFLFALGGLPD